MTTTDDRFTFDAVNAAMRRLTEILTFVKGHEEDRYYANVDHARAAFMQWEDDTDPVWDTSEEAWPEVADGPEVLALVRFLYQSGWMRADLSMRALQLGLCPLHLIDYEICLDDDDPGCAQVRAVFPYLGGIVPTAHNGKAPR